MRSVTILIFAALIFLSGCSFFEPELLPKQTLNLSESFSLGRSSPDSTPDLWQHFLKSDELDRIVREALEGNFDLQVLDARMKQARANLKKSEASFFPDLDFSFGGQKRGTQVKRSTDSGSTYDGSHSWDASIGSSYTPDIWGEAGADKMVKFSSYKASAQDLDAAKIELSAAIARTWVDIIAVRSKMEILDQQIKTNNTLLDLLKLRFLNGRATALEVSQQQEAIAQAGAQVPLLEKQERQLLNSLALLSGKTSAGSVRVESRFIPEAVPVPDIGIPSDLLDHRPDIKAAKQRLTSSQWEVKAAKADLLPSFTLSAQAFFSSGELDLLFHNWVASLVASVGGPLFDGGLRRAEVERAKAAAMEQIGLYAKIVAAAVFEVEDSLVGVEKQDAYIQLLEEELSLARITLKDARVQYLNGRSSFLNYLVAWTGIQSLERQLAGEKAAAIKERITLCEVLGMKKSMRSK